MNASKVMLITGSRKGIGHHLATYYLEEGFTVIGCSRKSASFEHESYQHFCLDVSDEPAVQELFAAIRKQHGRLDVLINNAGIGCMNPAVLTPVETVRRVYETNVTGTFLFSREAAKLMRKQPMGRIVNFTSVAAPLKLSGEAIYASSKSAVVSLTQILARELAPLRVTVNAIGPGPVDTDLLRGVPEKAITRVLAQLAIQRMATFSDITNVIDFFLKPESSFITGQVLYLGGV